MKTTAVFALFISAASAFAPQPFGRTQTAVQDKINTQIDQESPKVVNTDELAAGEKKVYCRCWKSGTFPLCDAAHVAHNKENGKIMFVENLRISKATISF